MTKLPIPNSKNKTIIHGRPVYLLPGGYFVPPWSLTDGSLGERTKGWCAFQDELKKHPEWLSAFIPKETEAIIKNAID